MDGFFGVVSKDNCVQDLFCGTDYHSHLGTRRGALAVLGSRGFDCAVHSIENAQVRSVLDLAGRRAIRELEGRDDGPLDECANPGTDRHQAMVDRIRNRLDFTTLRYQRLPDMLDAIALPNERVCTHCWDGVG